MRRFKTHLKSAFFFIFFLGIWIPSAWPQASVNVSVLDLDRVYYDIDKLVAHGLVDKIIMGQRPFSRREIARITAEAMTHLSRIKNPLEDPATPEKKKEKLRERLDYVQNILSRLQKDYHEELVQLGALEGEKSWYSLHPLEKAIVDTTVTNSPPETLLPENGIGRIDAVINPLVDYRQGRHIVDGGNLSLETTSWFRLTDYLAFNAQPRFQLAIGRNTQPNDNKAFVENLYGKIWVKNFEIEVGRDNIFFGQGLDSGLLLSSNSRGLDMAKISNDSPFFFPWVFKYMGANKFTFFYADLGPEQFFPNSYLVGYKWSLEPLSFFEVGLSLAVQGGGQGSPQASFLQRAEDIFPFTQFKSATQIPVSNKLGGLDIRFRIPPARNAQIYGEWIVDDTNSDFKTLLHDSGFIAGVYAPRLDLLGKVDLRLEYRRTGVRYYRHSAFFSGYTENQFIMGDNLGPDAQGFYVNSNWEVNRNNRLGFQGAFESRSSDIWTVTPDFIFVKVQDNPNERRYRVLGDWWHSVEGFPLILQAQLGYERVQNFNSVAGNDRNNFLGRLALQFKFDRWTHFPH